MNNELELMVELPHCRVLPCILELRSQLSGINSTILIREYFEIHRTHGTTQFTPEDAFYTLFNRYRSQIK